MGYDDEERKGEERKRSIKRKKRKREKKAKATINVESSSIKRLCGIYVA